MEFTAQQIADYLSGTIEGDPAVVVSKFVTIEEGESGGLAFLSNPKYERHIYSTRASIVLINRSQKLTAPVPATLIRVDDAYGALAQILKMAQDQMPRKRGVHPLACVEASASIGQDVYIGAFAYIGENATIADRAQIYPHVYIGDNVSVGPGSILYAGVRVYHQCEIGANAIVHSGAVIGADGFGFAPNEDGVFVKIPQLGNVVLGDEVEIGANTTIDRAAMASTTIEHRVKVDNLVQIAHNVVVKQDTAIAAQCGVAGSTKIGKHCILAGQVGVVGHIEIADGVQIGAQSGVNNSIRSPGLKLMGSPTMPLRDFYKCAAIFRKLPELSLDVSRLKREADGAETSE